MEIAQYVAGNDGKWVLELYLIDGCWTEQMKQDAEKHYLDGKEDMISEIKFC